VRAYGLWQGIELDTAALTSQGERLPTAGLAPKVVEKAMKYGYIINATDPTTLRLAPPLIISKKQIDPLIKDLPKIVAETIAEVNSSTGLKERHYANNTTSFSGRHRPDPCRTSGNFRS